MLHPSERGRRQDRLLQTRSLCKQAKGVVRVQVALFEHPAPATNSPTTQLEIVSRGLTDESKKTLYYKAAREFETMLLVFKRKRYY
jgi:hypothetical protein